MTIVANSRDVELKHALEAELEWTPAVDATRIGVAVNDGAVSLFGDVSSYPQKAAAVGRVRCAAGLVFETTPLAIAQAHTLLDHRPRGHSARCSSERWPLYFGIVGVFVTSSTESGSRWSFSRPRWVHLESAARDAPSTVASRPLPP